MIDSQNKEIVCLRNEIASLHTTISDTNRSLSQSQHNTIVSESTVSSDLSTKTYASVTQQNTPQQNAKVSTVNGYDRKFNVAVCGLKEPAEGTPRYQRSESDLQSVKESLESVDDNDNLSEYAIRDCQRLGRYNVSKHRPMLVKLSRTCDVASVLSKRKKSCLSTWYTN